MIRTDTGKMATNEKKSGNAKEEKTDSTSFPASQSDTTQSNNFFPFSPLNGNDYHGISSERRAYNSVREYADCLGNWLYQYRLWMALSTFQSAIIASMPPAQQNFAPNVAAFSASGQNFRIRSEIHGATAVNQNLNAGHRAENQYKIPSLWKRVAAEFFDFVLLFYTKLLVTFAFLKQIGYVQENLFELDTQLSFLYDINDLDYDRMFTLTSELIALEVINRTCITIVETLCIQKGYAGSIGGATPGKKIMNLRVVACDDIRDLGNRSVILEGARDPGLLNAFLRSMIKNFSMAFFFPACFTVFLFRFHRAAYDVLTHTVVVELEQPAHERQRQ